MSAHARLVRRLALEPLEDRTAPAVVGQLRIVNWNVLNVPNTSAMTTVLQEIGNQSFTSTPFGGGSSAVARPVDVLLLQEVDSSTGGQTAQVQSILNGLYGAGTYAIGTLQQSQASGGDRQAIVYRQSTVNLLGQQEVSGGTGPRAPMRYQLEADAAVGQSTFYVYNSHYDAVQAPDRLTEANAIRANSNALGNGVDILYVGDYNIQTSTEDMYDVALLGAGNGQAFDPINRPGSWNSSASFRDIHTQSTRTAALPDGGATGGMDDRFDFVLHTQEVGAVGTPGNGLGIEYRVGSYRAFGNDNTHALNGAITSGAGIYSSTVRTALLNSSDHLPVVVDYDIVTPSSGPTVTFTSASSSGAENGAALTITAQLSATTGVNVTVPFTVSGTATGGGVDYTITSSPLVIPANSLTGTITITPANDLLDENNETVVVTMGTPTNATQGATTVHTATITDDDPTPTVSFATASGSAAEGVATRTVTVNLSAASGLSVSVPYTISGTAANGTDYTISPASPLTIAPGATSATVTLTVTNDLLDENDETVVLTLGAPTNATLGSTTVYTETIADDDPAPAVTFTTASQTGAENVGTLTVTAQLSAVSGLAVSVPFTLSGTATGGGVDYTITSSPISIPAGATTGTITINVVDDSLAESSETVVVTMGAPTNATQGATTVHTAAITDNDTANVLQVSGFTATSSGFAVDFNLALDPVDLNLIDANGVFGASDVTLNGPSGVVAGTLVLNGPRTRATFVRTGGVLPVGAYTLTLRSAANGFKDTTGALLDGDANGTAGGDYTTAFTVSSTDRAVGLPDFARGYGQAVNVPATGAGLPLRVSDAAGVTSVQADILFDSALLTISTSGATPGPNGGTVTVTAISGGVRVTVAGLSGAAGANVSVANLVASVPTTAPYASKQVLDVQNVLVNGGAVAARDDDAVHIAAYLGDTNGSRTISGGDSSLASRVIAQIDTGFGAYQLADPVLVADTNASGTLSGGDASLISQKATGLAVPSIPDLPAGLPAPPAGGPDPVLFIGTAFAQDGKPANLGALTPGQAVTVPVSVLVTERAGISLAGATAVFRFDPKLFELADVRAGAIASGALGGTAFTIRAREVSPGVVVIEGWGARGPELAFGQTDALFLVSLRVRRDARPGSSALDLAASAGSVRTALVDNLGRELVLLPAPTDATNDDVDATVTVRPVGRARGGDVSARWNPLARRS